MRTEVTYPVPESEAGQKVSAFLTARGFSHHMRERLRREGALLLDGEKAALGSVLSSGQTLTVQLPPEQTDDWIRPQKIPLSIVYEDDDLLVIDKPAGLLVHPTEHHPEGTLANGLADYFRGRKEPFTFRVVGRLDQDTSGLLIIPRHGLSASILGNELTAGHIHRVYLAAATGDVSEVFPTGTGVIDAPIGPVPGEGMLRQVDPEHGQRAVTHVQVLGYREDLNISLCEVTLETGRTHQIRVHFQSIGHPLPGDFLYNPDDTLIHRTALHSYRLSFTQPITGEKLSFTAPLPADMQIFG